MLLIADITEEGNTTEPVGRCLQRGLSCLSECGAEENLRVVPDHLDSTLKLGWWDTRYWAAFQVSGSFWAGEGGIVHQRWVRNATVQRCATHNRVPVTRWACEQDFLLETEMSALSSSHKKVYQNICSSQTLKATHRVFVHLLGTDKIIVVFFLFIPPGFHTSSAHAQAWCRMMNPVCYYVRVTDGQGFCAPDLLLALPLLFQIVPLYSLYPLCPQEWLQPVLCSEYWRGSGRWMPGAWFSFFQKRLLLFLHHPAVLSLQDPPFLPGALVLPAVYLSEWPLHPGILHHLLVLSRDSPYTFVRSPFVKFFEKPPLFECVKCFLLTFHS